MKALVNLGEHATVSTPVIKAGLKHEDEDVRLGSAEALGGLGEFAASAVTDLTEALKKESCLKVRKAVADALGRIIASKALDAVGG